MSCHIVATFSLNCRYFKLKHYEKANTINIYSIYFFQSGTKEGDEYESNDEEKNGGTNEEKDCL